MAGLRDFLNSTAGKATGVVIVLVGVGAAIVSVRRGIQSPAAAANERTYIDAKTNKPYSITLKPGLNVPAPAPSGGNTGFPAELCFWTKDGKPKETPTPVLLNNWLDKEGPTFCPDCGRLVVGHNPRAGPDMKVPPTESEYKARRGSQQDQGR